MPLDADYPDNIRVGGISNPPSGHGMELGFDGTEGVIQAFTDRATTAYAPIYVGYQTKTPWVVVPLGLNWAFEVSEKGDGSPFLRMTLGSPSSPMPVLSGGRQVSNISAYVDTGTAEYFSTSYGLQVEMHNVAGSGGCAVGGHFRAIAEGTWSTPTVFGGATGIIGTAWSSRGGDIFGAWITAYAQDTAPRTIVGLEVDTQVQVNGAQGKTGIVINDVGQSTGAVYGTTFITGTNQSLPLNFGHQISASTGAYGFQYALVTAAFTASGQGPVRSDGALWLAGGFTTYRGMDFRYLGLTGPVLDLHNGHAIRWADAYSTETCQLVKTGHAKTLLNGNVLPLTLRGNEPFAKIEVLTTNGEFATAVLRGSVHQVVICMTSQNGIFTTTQGNAGTTNIYWNSVTGRYELENLRGFVVDAGVDYLSMN